MSGDLRPCSNCGATPRPGWKFCGKCRAQLPPPLHATKQQERAPFVESAISATIPPVAAPANGGEPLRCQTCHAVVEEGGGFCEHCGAKLGVHHRDMPDVSFAPPLSATPQDSALPFAPSPPLPSNKTQGIAASPSESATDAHPSASVSAPQVEHASASLNKTLPGHAGQSQSKPLEDLLYSDTKRPRGGIDEYYKDLAPTSPENNEKPAGSKRIIVTGIAGASVLLIGLLIALGSWLGRPTASVSRASNEPANAGSSNIRMPEGMLLVNGGTFQLGRDDGDEYERPTHAVSVGPFYIDKYEVTCEQYAKYVKETGSPPPPTWKSGAYNPADARLPVTGISWIEANAYTRWAGKRLPTEEEWELAARGTDGRRYPWGDDWKPEMANAGEHSAGRMVNVGSYSLGQSPSGALDMVGNAWEWTASDFKKYLDKDAKNSPVSNVEKVIRGGYWGSPLGNATTTFRTGWGARGEEDYSNTGFRCAADAMNNSHR